LDRRYYRLSIQRVNVWKLERLGLRSIGIPHASWHPLHKMATRNDPAYPMVTWLVAEK
jgi:hypothetical protein